MNLCMKQKVFFFVGDRFTVWDENGNDRYYVRGEVFSLGKKLHLTGHGRRGGRLHPAEGVFVRRAFMCT